jgi:REP element-mobilizing transposase RayT
MARPLRVEYPGAYYHVINRGNNQEKIFKKIKPAKLRFILRGELPELPVKIWANISVGSVVR